jgi:parallel beta-helix repeat protein
MLLNRSGARAGSRLFIASIMAGVVAVAAPAAATTWYVDGAKGGAGNPGTATAPFQTMPQAMKVAQPGDTVYVLPTTTYPMLSVTTSGTAGHPITVIGAGSSREMTRAFGGTTGFAIWINANYVNVENFDASTGSNYDGIEVAANHHHVLIADNVVHNCGGDGINAFTDDYVTISHNVVYDNAWYTAGGTFNSGISLLGNYDIDSSTAVKMIVDGNTIYANTNTPSCSTQQCLSTWADSDGSGIIDDTSQRERWDNVVYHGRTQISNNVIFGNGGRGVHIFKSDHVTIANNTMFSNNQDPYESFYHPGEVSTAYSGDVQVYNNILSSDGLSGPVNQSPPSSHVGVSFEYATDGRGPMIAEYNLIWDPQNAIGNEDYVDPTTTNPVTIASNTWGNPLFEDATLTASLANFEVKPTSPAMRRGNMATAIATDILGVTRTNPPTIGAYQKPGP